jgi:hypothetical protein
VGGGLIWKKYLKNINWEIDVFTKKMFFGNKKFTVYKISSKKCHNPAGEPIVCRSDEE